MLSDPERADDWKRRAACRGLNPELFFPSRGAVEQIYAKRVCAVCPVAAECLDYAIETHQTQGVWGGTSERQRRRIRRSRAAAKRVVA